MKPEVLRHVYLAILMFVLVCVAAPALTSVVLGKLLDTPDTTSAIAVPRDVLPPVCADGQYLSSQTLTQDGKMIFVCSPTAR